MHINHAGDRAMSVYCGRDDFLLLNHDDCVIEADSAHEIK